jgi:hypothetical protein
MYPPTSSDPPPPAYGGGPTGVGAASASGATGKAIVILVLGIFGVVCCPVTAPIAWVLGQSELAAVRRGAAPAANEALAQIGMVLGILGTVLFVFFLLWIFAFGGLAALSVLLHS